MRPDLLCSDYKKSAYFAIKLNIEKMKKEELSKKRCRNKIKIINRPVELLKQGNRP